MQIMFIFNPYKTIDQFMNKRMTYLTAVAFLMALLFSCQSEQDQERITAAPGGGRSLMIPEEEGLSRVELQRDKLPADWSLVGAIQGDGWPVTTLTTIPGDGIIYVDAGKATSLHLPLEHGSTDLMLEFIHSPNAFFGLYLQGRYRLDLQGPAGAGTLYSGSQESGETAGRYTPLVAAERSPGVWQRLRIVFKAPQFDEQGKKVASATVDQIYLNGQLIHHQRELYAPSTGATAADEIPLGGLVLWAERGQAAIRNLQYRQQTPPSSYVGSDGVPVLVMPTLRYQYYEWPGTVDRLPDLSQRTPKKSGQAPLFDLAYVQDRAEQYGILYEGVVEIPKAGEYTFFVKSDDGAKLYIDDQLLIDNDGTHAPEEKQGQIELTEGPHTLQLAFFQGGGGDYLTVAYRASGGQQRYLNSTDPEEAAQPPAGRQLEVMTDAEPYLLRSFVYFPIGQSSRKRTHAISVGEANGPHYTLDLSDGSLLMAWNGAFVDALEMWDNRGIPQIVRPMGATVAFAGDPQWAILNEPAAAWPDTLASDPTFRHLRYELDDQGRPTFHYQYGEARLTDRLLPGDEPRSLVRHLSASEMEGNLYALLARGAAVTKTATGQYYIEGGDYIISVREQQNARIYIREEGATQAVVARFAGDEAAVSYQIDW